MNSYSKLKYLLEINFFNIIFCAIIILISGFLWGLVMFMSVGILVGLFGFKTFKENEYFAYYNFGITKKNLIINVFIINSIISLTLYFILSLC